MPSIFHLLIDEDKDRYHHQRHQKQNSHHIFSAFQCCSILLLRLLALEKVEGGVEIEDLAYC